MTISKKNKEFLDELIEYYINEAQSYKEMAQEYSPKTNSVVDTAFGLIIGCVYSSFLQAYSNQQQAPSSEDHSRIQRNYHDKLQNDKRCYYTKK